MAKKRPPMPSVDTVNKRYQDGLQNLFDQVLSDGIEKDDAFEVTDTGGPTMFPTSSSNPQRPRTLRAGYDYNTRVLTVVFRDGTWWDYRNVPSELWEAFKAADSKGKFLKASGLDSWNDMGESNVDEMPKHRRMQMNDINEFAEYMYGRNR